MADQLVKLAPVDTIARALATAPAAAVPALDSDLRRIAIGLAIEIGVLRGEPLASNWRSAMADRLEELRVAVEAASRREAEQARQLEDARAELLASQLRSINALRMIELRAPGAIDSAVRETLECGARPLQVAR